MSKVLDFIPDDGYTENAFIASIPRVHNDVRFTFRPMLIEDQTKWMNKSSKLKDDVWTQNAATMLAERIKSWDIVDQDDKVLPLVVKHLLMIKPALFMRLYGIVLGTDASDVDPNWGDEEKLKIAMLHSKSIATGVNPGVVREVEDLKN